MDAQQLFLLSIFLYVAGAIASLALNKADRYAIYVSGLCAFGAAIVGMASVIPVLSGGTGFTLEATGFIPFARFIIQVDSLSAFMVLVISLLSAATAIYSLSYMEEYVGRGAGVMGFFNNLFIASMALVVTIGNAFYFLIFWEMMTLASYFLVCFDQEDEEGVKAGFIYLLMAHAGTAMIMLSFILFFVHTGTFDFASFRSANLPPATKHLAFLLAFFGFGAKAGIVPLHIWLPRAHPAAPSNASALMSGVMIKTAIYGILRVGVDFLGSSAWWWGLTVLAFGAISAVLGVLYALGEHDLKRLLAYHSVENVGIILMGTGVGMIGVASGQPVLGVLGILAGLYHLINHAVFKGLLFLGAGSVVYRVHTKNMEEMGGLARRMPWTGLAFLIGAVAISAIPPLNGFVSEWFTYQSLFIASTSGILTVKVLSPLFGVMLALTGALAAMCFVKAYGVTFAGPFRSKHAREAREVPVPMLTGMAILAAGCIALGLGAPVVAPYIGNVASALLGTSPVRVSDGLLVFPASSSQAMLSTPLIALLLVGLVTLPLLIVGIQGGMQAGRRIDSEPWACGYKYSPRMASTASAFAQPLRVLFRPVYLLRTTLEGPGYTIGSYFDGAVVYVARVESMWEHYLYGPLARGTVHLGKRVQALQIGNVRLYCLYIIVTLVILLIATVR
ncbi:MAG: hydrogenase 4 subunit B [Moorella humiferrea]|nr:hydrogenase 4 subunit B [Moorella humiferrea]